MRAMLATVAAALLLTLGGCTGDDEPDLAPDLALKVAAATGDLDAALAALEEGADVDAAPSGTTALAVAALEGDLAMVELLIEAGASVGVRDAAGDTELHRAAYYAPGGVVRALVDAGADPDAAVGAIYFSRPLHAAATKGNIEAMDALLAAGADPALDNGMLRDVLDYAACHGQSEAVLWALEHADLDPFGASWCAWGQGFPELGEMLASK